jgi:hypothetical protein
VHPELAERDRRVGLLGVFASPAVESAYRLRRLADDRWIWCLLVAAATLRVALFLGVDYQHFGSGATFWPLLASRLVFVAVSLWALLVLRRAVCPAAADRLCFTWAVLLAALTVFAIAARPPDNVGPLFLSCVPVVVIYGVTPLPLARQGLLALTYSAAVLFVCRRADDEALGVVSLVYALCNLFGAVMSWRLQRRRREVYLGSLREAELRSGLEQALAEIRTLRGLLCICAWCKRIRDEAQSWETVETYVQNHTHAAFTHGICPECLESKVQEVARLRG